MGNYNELYKIEGQFDTLEQANIGVEGLFLNVDTGFDSKEFHRSCEKKEIQGNICFNKRNNDTSDRDEYFDPILYKERYKIERINGFIGLYSIGLI